jgi:hypothetical protein
LIIFSIIVLFSVTIPESSQVPEPVSIKKDPVTVPTTSVSSIKRGPHPMAAAWTAGLTLSPKGVAFRRPEPSLASASSVTVNKPQVGDRHGAIEIKTIKPKEDRLGAIEIKTIKPKEDRPAAIEIKTIKPKGEIKSVEVSCVIHVKCKIK